MRRLTEENEDLLGQLDTMDEKLRVESGKGEPDFEHQLKISEEARAKADKELESIKSRFEAESDSAAELQRDNAKLTDDLMVKSSRLAEMEIAFNEANGELEVARQKLTESENTTESIRAQLEEAEKKCENVQQSHSADLEERMKAEYRKVAELEESKAQVEGEMKALASRNQAMEMELTEVRGELSDAKQKLTESETVQDSGLETEKKYALLCDDFDEIKEKLKAESDKVTELLDSKAKVESEFEKLSSKNRGVEMEVQEVKSELSDVRQKFEEAEALATSLKSQLDDAGKNHEELAEILKAKEVEMSTLATELSSAKETNANLEVNLEKSANANHSKEHLETALKEINDLKEKEADQAEKINIIEETNRSLKADKEQLVNEIARRASDYDGLVAKLSSSMKGLASDYRRFRTESAEVVEAERAGLARFREEQELALARVKQSLLRQIAEAESQNSDLIDEMNQVGSTTLETAKEASICPKGYTVRV